MIKLKEGRNSCTNKEYHSQKEWLSSSSLKKLLKGPGLFYKEEILGEKPPEKENPAFSEGSYFHSLILEPDKIAEEYAFFDGFRKAGVEWEQFRVDYAHKTILSRPQKARVEAWVRVHNANKIATSLLKGGESEVTICRVWNGVPIKVRADYANIEAGYLVDLKTSGHCIELDNFKLTCQNYGYLLSASLYCSIFELEFGKPFDFYFSAVAKQEMDSQVFKLSEKSRQDGEQQCVKAAGIYKKCLATGTWPEKVVKADITQAEILEV